MKSKTGEVRAIILVALSAATCGGKSVTPSASATPPSVPAAMPPGSPPNSGKGSPLQSLHWRGKSKNLEVRAVNGPVRAVLGSGDEADIVANVLKSKHGTPLRLQVIEKNGLTLACVVSANEEERDDDDDDHGHSRGDHHAHREHGDQPANDGDECGRKLHGTAVELLVQVPRGTKFAGWTVNGAVEAQGLEGEVEAHTQNGSIHIETSGVARASTVNGPIRAKIGAKTWNGTLALESVNGRLEVELPSDVGAELRADTVHGSVRVTPRMDGARIEDNHVEGRLGKGGGELRLRTVNGPIEVR
ncbi:MAG: DUF4097 family beta strand repeat-containing protein [Polyangiaceae bacterium]